MTVVTRFVTHVDVDDTATDHRQLSVSARLAAVLPDGRSLTLLDDRGWSSSPLAAGAHETDGVRAWISVEDIETTARMVTGPDEPADGETARESAAGHWARLAATLRRQGVEADARELERLPHEVVLSERLRAWTAGEPRG